MQCKNPYIAPGGKAYGCGQCLPCRVNKRREWTHRIMLEAAERSDNAFVTVTYDEQHLPEGNGLRPRDLSLFLKRFRRALHPLKIRYFAVGEYGEQTQRPHYHLAVFGYPPCSKGGTNPNRGGYCCPICERVQRDWAMGNIYNAELTQQSAAYIAGYVTKKLTNAEDPRLDGKHPEFARMSNRPGIGANFCDDVASTLLTHRLDTPETLPTHLRHGSQHLPLGRYLRRRLVERSGIDEEEYKKYTSEKAEEALRPLREIAAHAPVGSKSFAFKQALIDSAEGKIKQIETKYKPKKGTL